MYCGYVAIAAFFCFASCIENQRKSKQFKDRFNEKFFRSFKLPNFPVLKFIES